MCIYRTTSPAPNPSNITPADVYEYLVEIRPVGQVFRPGHRIALEIHMPPWVASFYVYVPRSAPTLNSVLHGTANPSHVMLPMVPVPAGLGPELPCGA